MPYKVDKFVCSLCHSEYNNLGEAKECENKGIPVEGGEHKEGQDITYQNEDGGVRWVYSSLTNKILLKMIRNINNTHAWVYVVQQNILGVPTHEKAVLLVDNEFGKGWFAPAELTYQLGFAEYTRNILSRIEQEAEKA